MKKATVFLVTAAFIGVATATTIGVYGSITGTANVDAAVVVDSYEITNDEATIRNNADVTVDGTAENLEVNLSGKETIQVSDTLASGDTKTLTFGNMTDGDTLYVNLDGNTVNTAEVTTQ